MNPKQIQLDPIILSCCWDEGINGSGGNWYQFIFHHERCSFYGEFNDYPPMVEHDNPAIFDTFSMRRFNYAAPFLPFELCRRDNDHWEARGGWVFLGHVLQGWMDLVLTHQPAWLVFGTEMESNSFGLFATLFHQRFGRPFPGHLMRTHLTPEYTPDRTSYRLALDTRAKQLRQVGTKFFAEIAETITAPGVPS